MQNLRKLVYAIIMIALLVASFGFTSTARANANWPDGFCDNKVGQPFNNPSELPSTGCTATGRYVVTSDAGNKGNKYYATLDDLKAQYSGKGTVWFEPGVSVPSAANQTNKTAANTCDERTRALWDADQIYRSQGWRAWLSHFGVDGSALEQDSRQPVEQTFVCNGETKVTVVGLIIKGSVEVKFPAALTTDRHSNVVRYENTACVQPDPRNGSYVYTNVKLDNSFGTIYARGDDWGQMKNDQSKCNLPGQYSGPGDALVTPVAVTPAVTEVPTEIPVYTETLEATEISATVTATAVLSIATPTPAGGAGPGLELFIALLILAALMGAGLAALFIRRPAAPTAVTPPSPVPVAPTPAPAPTPAATPLEVAELKAAVPNLTDRQADLLVSRFGTKEALATADVNTIRNRGQMSADKAQAVHDWANA